MKRCTNICGYKIHPMTSRMTRGVGISWYILIGRGYPGLPDLIRVSCRCARPRSGSRCFSDGHQTTKWQAKSTTTLLYLLLWKFGRRTENGFGPLAIEMKAYRGESRILMSCAPFHWARNCAENNTLKVSGIGPLCMPDHSGDGIGRLWPCPGPFFARFLEPLYGRKTAPKCDDGAE